MTLHKDPLWRLDCILIIIAFAAICLILFSGCNFARKLDKTETKKDTVAVSSIDSNWLKKVIEQNSNTKSSGQEIKIYGRDTTIFNTPINNYYPSSNDGMYSNLIATISSWQHENQSNTKEAIDSGSMERKDSTAATLQATTKETETKAGTPWYIYAFAAALAYLLLKGLLPKFKIVKA